jgi:hypothetical protein
MRNLYSQFKDHVIWLGGDANLPDIDWSTDNIKRNQYSIPINQSFIDTLNDIGIEQIVHFPTRNENILDIFCTNRPTLVDRCYPIPGLSDHDTVLIDTNLIPNRQKPIQRKICLWKKVNITAMREDLSSFSSSFTAEYSTATHINTLWSIFKNKCTAALEKFVPSKLTSTRYSQPWMNRPIKRLARQKKSIQESVENQAA